jgi:hypothetical protein
VWRLTDVTKIVDRWCNGDGCCIGIDSIIIHHSLRSVLYTVSQTSRTFLL